MQGIVEFFNGRYGFIKPLAGGGADTKSIYFHVSAIARPEAGWIPGIPPGAEVQFDLVRSEKGPQCGNVRLVKLSGAVVAPPLPIDQQLARFRDRSRAKRAAKEA